MSKKKAIVKRDPAPLARPDAEGVKVVKVWASATTKRGTKRRQDMIRDKQRALIGDGLLRRQGKSIAGTEGNSPLGFFSYIRKQPADVTPEDVLIWREYLESFIQPNGKPLNPRTVYFLMSHLSTFYAWGLSDPRAQMAGMINPVTKLVRPKPPKAYTRTKYKFLSRVQVDRLSEVIRERAELGNLVARRDFAIMSLLVGTGIRRAEAIGLTWGQLELVTLRDGKQALRIPITVKRGKPRVITATARIYEAICDYLREVGRLDGMEDDSPLFVRHDQGKGEAPDVTMTTHSFVANLKRYAKLAGLGDVRCHQLRHSYAAALWDAGKSDYEVMAALGHDSIKTTRLYKSQIYPEVDHGSAQVLDYFNFFGDNGEAVEGAENTDNPT